MIHQLRSHWLLLATLGGATATAAAPAVLPAQTTMIGIVRDDSTGRPLPGVEVLLNGTAHATVTNDAGRYSLAGLPAGNHQAIFRIVGYLPARVNVLLSAGDTLRVNQVLVPSTVVLDPIEVTGEPDVGLAGRGFHERMKMGFGRFYEPEELREMEHLRLSDVLRRKGGVEIQPALPGASKLVAVNPKYRNASGHFNCYMTIYLDGRMLWRGGNNYTGEEMRDNPPPDILRDFSIHQIEGVEVYTSSAGIPVEFGGTSGQCGAVVLWTRRSP
ncbi:MAG: carboxypeptidase-like regulatory domain-containing protein [Gemmatimonadales bacterium]